MAKDEKTSDSQVPPPPQKWYSVKEASEYLGVSQPTIFRWMKDGTLSFYKVGGGTRFSQEVLDAVVEKSTGSKEAEQVLGRCVACGHNVLVEGKLRGAGQLYFKPNKSSFWVLHEAMVPTDARVCTACGYVHHYADKEKLRQLKAETVRVDGDDEKKSATDDTDFAQIDTD